MRRGALTIIALALAAPVAAQDVKAGVDAWSAGDFAGAVAEWRGPAVAGDADAQFNMGQAYKLGRGVPIDPAQAESWFLKAARQGHAGAEDNYGLALFTAGRRTEAAPWLEKSVARGEPRAQLVLGTMLFNGDGVPRDIPRAYALVTVASQAGLISASETLVQMDPFLTPAERESGVALARQQARPAQPTDNVAAASPVTAPPPKVAAVTIAKTPAPKPPPVTKPAQPIRGPWRIQLGAFRDEGNAQALWNRLKGRIDGATPAYVKAGTVVRLQATGFASRGHAQRGCAASAVPCMVMAP